MTQVIQMDQTKYTTPQEREEIKRLYKSGLTVKQLMVHFNRTKMSIRHAISSNKPVRRFITETDKEQIRQMKESGWKCYEIADKLNVPRSTVTIVLKEEVTKKDCFDLADYLQKTATI